MNSPAIRTCNALLLALAGLTLTSAATAAPLSSLAARALDVQALTPAAGAGMMPAASHAAARQFDEAETQAEAIGTWTGRWTSDLLPRTGELLLTVESASGGKLSGKGSSTGGPCARDFTMTGSYRGSLVQLTLDFPQGAGDCAAARVSISMRAGRKGDQVVAVGHWAVSEGGPGAGRLYGIVELTK